MRSIAAFISTIGNPIVIALFFGIYIYFSDIENESLRNLPILFSLIVILPLAAFVSYQVFSKKYEDFDVSNQTKRNEVYKLLIFLFIVLLAVLVFGDYPRKAVILAVILLAYIVLAFLINQKVKVSMHTGICYLFVWIFYPINPVVSLGLFLFGFPIIWSRLQLGRHSQKEVVYGFALGNLVGLIYVLVFNWII